MPSSAADSGRLHYALVTNGATAPNATQLSAARTELSNWLTTRFS